MTETAIATADRSANPIGFLTLVKREMVRTFSIINQVVWPPVIQTLLYVYVLGFGLGSQIRTVNGVPYAHFLIPGLIMMQVIDQTYSEGSSTVFQGRFMNSIQELLISPLSAFEMVMGYVVAGFARAMFIALVITVLGGVLVQTWPINWGIYFLTIVLVSILFASAGIVMGLFAEKFDHVALLTTFVVTPLVFVGGVFTSINFMPPAFRAIAQINPMFQMINAFRYAYQPTGDAPLVPSLIIIAVLAAACYALALRLVSVGFKLRT